MDKFENSSSRLAFMIPILMFVLFFVLCCGVMACVFIKAADSSRRAEQYGACVQICRNELERLRALRTPEDSGERYFDSGFMPTEPGEGVYVLELDRKDTPTETGTLFEYTLCARAVDGGESYKLAGAVYLPSGGMP